MVLVYWSTRMVLFIKANGNKIKDMVKVTENTFLDNFGEDHPFFYFLFFCCYFEVYLLTKMKLSIKAGGKMMKNKVEVTENTSFVNFWQKILFLSILGNSILFLFLSFFYFEVYFIIQMVLVLKVNGKVFAQSFLFFIFPKGLISSYSNRSRNKKKEFVSQFFGKERRFLKSPISKLSTISDDYSNTWFSFSFWPILTLVPSKFQVFFKFLNKKQIINFLSFLV